MRGSLFVDIAISQISTFPSIPFVCFYLSHLLFLRRECAIHACASAVYYAIFCYVGETKRMVFANALLNPRSEQRLTQQL